MSGGQLDVGAHLQRIERGQTLVRLQGMLQGAVNVSLRFREMLQVVVEDGQVHVEVRQPALVPVAQGCVQGFVVIVQGRIRLVGAAVEDAQVVVDTDVRLQVVHPRQVGQDAFFLFQRTAFVALVDVEGGLFVQQDGVDGRFFCARHGEGAVEAGLCGLQLAFAHQGGGAVVEAVQEGVFSRFSHLRQGAERH